MTDTAPTDTAAPDTPTTVARHPARTALGWVAGVVVGVLLGWAGTTFGLWFAPLVIGLLVGVGTCLRGTRWPAAYGTGVAIAVVGWLLPLALRAADGQPVLDAADTTADLAGFAGAGIVVLLATVLIAALQAIVGTWLGRAMVTVTGHRPARK